MGASLQSAQAEPHAISETIGEDNRQWAQLLPAGQAKTKDARGPYIIAHMARIIAASFQGNGDKLAVDYDHAIDLAAPKGQPAPAAGWIEQMQERSDGIWGLIEWTPAAASAIRAKEYRFLSPVFLHTPDKQVVSILRASLTNNPNLTMKALNAAQGENHMDMEAMMAELRTALSLPDDADAAAILAGVKKLTESRNSADPALFVPIDMFQQTVAELNKLRSGVSLQAAENIVDTAVKDGRILPFMKPWAVSLCQSNAAAFDDFLNGAGKPITDFVTDMMTPHDMSSLHQRDRERAEGNSAQLTEVHEKLGLTAEDVKAYGGKS